MPLEVSGGVAAGLAIARGVRRMGMRRYGGGQAKVDVADRVRTRAASRLDDGRLVSRDELDDCGEGLRPRACRFVAGLAVADRVESSGGGMVLGVLLARWAYYIGSIF